jgi:transposase InsO family protein
MLVVRVIVSKKTLFATESNLQNYFTVAECVCIVRAEFGSRRLLAALNLQGVSIGLCRVRTLMGKERLKPLWKRKFTHTTDSNHKNQQRQCVKPSVYARRRKSGLGQRYNIYTHSQQLAVSCSSFGLVFSQECGWAMA